MSSTGRDHLFISYATEDWEFAQWLALKLTAAGYAVWCDRLKLLGGESYPEDIDAAIRDRTFRFLALISKHSVHKANPRKERTLALNLARERGEDFILPLNLDGVSPTDMGWMLSDLTYIPFDSSWFDGIQQLLAKLESVNAPQAAPNGGEAVSDWLRSRDRVSKRPERIWTNLVPLKTMPESLLRVRLADASQLDLLEGWPHFRQGHNVFWAFELPSAVKQLNPPDIEIVRWDEPYRRDGERPRHVATRLLRGYVQTRARNLGLTWTPDGKHLHFPPGLLPGDRLKFESYDGRRSSVKTVGIRTSRLADGREQTRYHLSPAFKPSLLRYGEPAVQVHMHLFLSDLNGRPLKARKAARRRKAISKDWWNHDWLIRTLAVVQWTASGEAAVDLALTSDTRIVLSGQPLSLTAPIGLDESTLNLDMLDEDRIEDEIDETLFDDDSDGDDDDYG